MATLYAVRVQYPLGELGTHEQSILDTIGVPLAEGNVVQSGVVKGKNLRYIVVAYNTSVERDNMVTQLSNLSEIDINDLTSEQIEEDSAGGKKKKK
jgi:hypothetical protein